MRKAARAERSPDGLAGLTVADTSAVLALVDSDDRDHHTFIQLYENSLQAWILPWAILPEVDYLLRSRTSPRTAALFLDDVVAGRYAVEWGEAEDMERSVELGKRYESLELGLVDGVVMAVAERLGATAIATLDERDFGAVELKSPIKILPRDR